MFLQALKIPVVHPDDRGPEDPLSFILDQPEIKGVNNVAIHLKGSDLRRQGQSDGRNR